ncbi:hypothetical protein PLICRDRAFT_159473 [Plicaturopsis crispa FD-325 SS-3]|nr:hypothetical protein PLICRDRAFT_159473 [Plicaturopsis crispa FD-325 SS-3]
MDSASARAAAEQKRQADLRRQIAQLQAELGDQPEPSIPPPPTSPKRSERQSTLLVPATPSPKKRKLDHPTNGPPKNLSLQYSRHATASSSKSKPKEEHHPVQPAPSTLLSKLANLNTTPVERVPDAVNRTTGFSERPQPQLPMSHPEDDGGAPKRDDRLALIEELEIGPYEHKPLIDDPTFETLEPNSGIRLSSRVIPHDDMQDYLSGRYYISPSRLYASIRLLPNKQGYDVPVAGDWVTIAVVAERGQIKHTKAPVAITREGGEAQTSKGKGKAEPPRPHGKKYVNMKLIDFGSRSRSASSATGGKAVIRGDAFLTLLLFESDGFDRVTSPDGGKTTKLYKGGSKGAFESMSKVKEGDVIALLNPKVLKPFQRSNDTPHPVNNILALTPESASSIAVIGRSRDLGMCTVKKKDGKVCGSWYDKRVSEVCEWHVQNAVEHRRAGRAEFSIGTSGMSNSTKRKPLYDPAKQWGLKPAEASGSTYVISGHVVSGSGVSDPKSMYVAETMGREGQAKAARRMSAKDSDRTLKALLERDKEGMRAVVRAREVAAKAEKGASETSKAGKSQPSRSKQKRKRGSSEDSDDNGEKESAAPQPNPHQKTYSAQVIKDLGFDPAIKPGQRRAEDPNIQKKLEALAALQSSRRDIELGPRPGQRIRSGVFKPPEKPVEKKSKMDASYLPELDQSDEDLDSGLVAPPPPVDTTSPSPPPDTKMVDLDGSSDCENM